MANNMDGSTTNKGLEETLRGGLELVVADDFHLPVFLLLSAVLVCSPPFTLTISSNCSAITDTEASRHYFLSSAPIIDLNHTAPPITIGTGTGQHRSSSATAAIHLPMLPAGRTRIGCIMPAFTNNLLSIGTLRDAKCTAIFTHC